MTKLVVTTKAGAVKLEMVISGEHDDGVPRTLYGVEIWETAKTDSQREFFAEQRRLAAERS